MERLFRLGALEGGFAEQGGEGNDLLGIWGGELLGRSGELF